MRNQIKKTRINMSASSILTVIFLLFIIITGVAAIPDFIENTKSFIKEEKHFDEYIDIIDAQYEKMLDDDQETAAIHNKSTYINFNGLMARLLNHSMVNERVLLKNGHLSTYDAPEKRDEVKAVSEKMTAFYKIQKDSDGSFLFVIAPSQLHSKEKLLPEGFKDASDENADLFVELLEEEGVPVLDLRQKLIEQGIDNTESFFRTDHHWKPETGFWAYKEIVKKLEDMKVFSEIDEYYIENENYEFRVYEDSFLGSSGKRTGKYFAGVDDFSLIIPKYDTDISVTIESIGVKKQGNFENTAYRFTLDKMEKMLNSRDYFNDNPYGLYGWGDKALTNWRNKEAVEQKRLLLIGESFGNVPFSLLPLYNGICDEVDFRHYQDDFKAYYKEFNPDTVIVLVNPLSIVSANTTFDIPVLED